MASLKDMRNRIASVKATRKITKAMQMVAAAKLRRAQEAATAARPYAERMAEVLGSLASKVADKNGASPLLIGTGKDQVHLLIVMTAERGLCGGFNSNIAKLARAHANRLIAEGKTVKILTVGRKGAENLRRDLGRNIIERKDFQGVRQLTFTHAEGVANRVLEMFEAGEFDVATLFFSEFKSVIAQKPTALQLIPATVAETAGDAAKGGGAAVHEYEPSEEEVLGFLLSRNISTQIFRGLLENSASFYGSQMTAMDNATRNAGDMINKLTIKYNRQRQANITKELIEIISGAEAV
ncbi:F0F1 ATP synthase subunit gamma [Hyphomicrobium sp. 99]|uniref:F0F1 ATP synthase subunit gamma n=1 Tax=Hyphomicrobium sp. 99 TaxID=1163419 RepID=UPI0005F80942|nr:F0F1 ATP synthase subunit gamma [Hyphomicrobium sp. 99]